MELASLVEGLVAVAGAGSVLSCEEVTCLQASLTLLKGQERLQQVFFWGKVLGSSADYYVAYGVRPSEAEFPAKAFYFAGEDFHFRALPRLTEEAAEGVLELALERPFEGVPSSLLVPATEGEEAKLTELDRLAQVVQEIDFDTAVVPKGAFVLTEGHLLEPASGFLGLGVTEAASHASYVHFRPSASIASLRASARTDADFFENCLDSLEDDLPRGCWAVRQDPAGQTVTLRSLSWPGYVAYHVPETPRFGGFYVGHAQKNRDLAFIV